MDAATLMEIIRRKTRKGSVYFTDSFRSSHSLHRFGKHYRVNHGKTCATHRAHINGIEGFWSFAKHRLYNYRGVSRANFPYLPERDGVAVESPQREYTVVVWFVKTV